MLSVTSGNSGQPSLAMEYASRAYALREHATEPEQLIISGLYFRATGQVEKQMETLKLWEADYPRESVPHNNRGACEGELGRPEIALSEFKEAVRLDPNSMSHYSNLGTYYLRLNQLEEAKKTFDQALAHNLDGARLRQNIYYLVPGDELVYRVLVHATGSWRTEAV